MRITEKLKHAKIENENIKFKFEKYQSITDKDFSQMKEQIESLKLKCIKCENNCLSCTSTICNKCKEGYYISGNKCIKCQSNCSSCPSTKCTKCKDGYYLSKDYAKIIANNEQNQNIQYKKVSTPTYNNMNYSTNNNRYDRAHAEWS